MRRKSAGDYRPPVSHSQVSTRVGDAVLDFLPGGDIVPKRSAFLGRRVMLRGWAGAGPWAIEWPSDGFAGIRERGGTLLRQRRTTLALFFLLALLGRFVIADAYDPPASYYNAAVGTGTTLKSQLHTIITTGDTSRTYDQLRSDLQVTDADPNDPTKIRVVYNNGVTITKVTSGTTGIPGWDNGVTWNREHTWPQNRGVESTSGPDGSDMFHLFPAKNSDNSSRQDLNYGGVYGQQNRGIVSDGGSKYYPGDADVGL